MVLKINQNKKFRLFAFNQSNRQAFACAACTYFLYRKKVGKEPFKGRNPLREFLPLKIPSSTR